ncbi:glutathione-regulated potassium-efflux system protein KefC [Photobacterium aphoticum]|nr:glutathione-regulated potassium-efflux system protein KefC [Photobacterium aphoticum]
MLYQAWRDNTEESKFNATYRDLFIQLEEALSEEMKAERHSKQASSERGWTPPPKGYADVIEELQKDTDDPLHS